VLQGSTIAARTSGAVSNTVMNTSAPVESVHSLGGPMRASESTITASPTSANGRVPVRHTTMQLVRLAIAAQRATSAFHDHGCGETLNHAARATAESSVNASSESAALCTTADGGEAGGTRGGGVAGGSGGMPNPLGAPGRPGGVGGWGGKRPGCKVIGV
jgi:hypothetical protein